MVVASEEWLSDSTPPHLPRWVVTRHSGDPPTSAPASGAATPPRATKVTTPLRTSSLSRRESRPMTPPDRPRGATGDGSGDGTYATPATPPQLRCGASPARQQQQQRQRQSLAGGGGGESRDPSILVGQRVYVEGVGVGRVTGFAKSPNPLVHSRHTVNFDGGDGAETKIVLRRRKVTRRGARRCCLLSRRREARALAIVFRTDPAGGVARCPSLARAPLHPRPPHAR